MGYILRLKDNSTETIFCDEDLYDIIRKKLGDDIYNNLIDKINKPSKDIVIELSQVKERINILEERISEYSYESEIMQSLIKQISIYVYNESIKDEDLRVKLISVITK